MAKTKSENQAKYAKTNTVYKGVQLNKKTDSLILDQLEGKSFQGYVKELILKDVQNTADVLVPEEHEDDREWWFFILNGKAHQYNFVFGDEDGYGPDINDVDDTTYIEDSNEIYINGKYYKLDKCMKVDR